MNCSCIHVDLQGDGDYPEYRKTEEPLATNQYICCECKDVIEKGKIYRKETAKFKDRKMTIKTCMDCVSIRDTFFCDNWYYEMIFEYLREHIKDMNGEISEDCITQLTPKARDRVCEIIENVWE